MRHALVHFPVETVIYQMMNFSYLLSQVSKQHAFILLVPQILLKQ